MHSFAVRWRHRLNALHPHVGVVVRHTSGRVGYTPSDNDVSFWPVDLQIASRDRSQNNGAFKPANFIRQSDSVIFVQTQFDGVECAHQHRIARRAIQRVDFGIHERVELFASSG